MNVSLPQHLVHPVAKCGNPADIVTLNKGFSVSKLEIN
jgi:hypothetical protein